MNTRVALIGIVVENTDSVMPLNTLLDKNDLFKINAEGEGHS